MAIAVVGIQVKVGGISDSVKQFKQLKASVDDVIRSVKSLSNVKAPRIKNLNIVQGGVGVFDQKAIDNSAKLNTGLTKVNNTTKNVTSSISRLSTTTNTTTTAITNMGRALRVTGKAAAITATILGTGFGKALRAVGTNLSAFGRRLTTFGSVLSTFGFRITTFLSLPIAAGIGGSIKAAISFEDAMVDLITKVGLGTEAVGDLGDAALSLAPTLGVDPVDLLTAAYQPLSRGIRDTAVAMDIIVASAKASAIGLGEVEDIAKLVTSVMVAYGPAAGDAAKITDTLTSAIQFGSAEADEFVAPMGRAIGLASGLGVSFEELTAFMGTFAATGAPVTSVVTGMSRVFATFVNPAQEAKDAFFAIGTSAEELSDTIARDGLAATIIELTRALDEANIPLSDVFGRITGLNAVMFLAGNASELYLDTLQKIKDGAGSLEAAFATVTESTSFQLKVFQSTLKSTGILIGSVLLPALNKILAAVTPVIAAIGQFARLHPQVILLATAFALVIAAIGPVIIAFGILTSSIGIIIAALGSFLTIAGSILAVLTPLGAGFIAVAAAIGTLFIALRALTIDFDLTFSNIASRAVTWGENIMIELANGLARGFIYVVNQLIALGQLFAFWLAPGSAPNLLPDLAGWGSNVIAEFMLGFSQIDQGIFSDVAGVFESFFRSLSTDILSAEDLIPSILFSRDLAAAAIGSGDLTALLAQVRDSFGSLAPVVEEYIQTLFDLAAATEAVEAAQSDIADINDRFSDTVKPLNDELGDIADRFAEVNRSQEEEALQKILADPRAPALAKELALLQLRRLELQAQVGDAEDQRDVELEVANARLTAAQEERTRLQEQADLQKATIDLQIEQNNLIKDQVALLDRLAKAAERAAKAGAAAAVAGSGFAPPGKVTPERGGKGAAKGLPTVKSLSDLIGEGILGAGGELFATFEKLAKKLQAPFLPLLGPNGLISKLADTWREVFNILENLDTIDFSALAKNMIDTFVGGVRKWINKRLPPAWEKIRITFVKWLAKNFNLFSDSGGSIVDKLIAGFFDLRDKLWTFLIQALFWVIDRIKEIDWVGVAIFIKDAILLGLATFRQSTIDFFNEWYPVIKEWFRDQDWEAFGQILSDLIGVGIELLLGIIDTFFPDWKQAIADWFNGIVWSEIPANLVNGVLDGMATLHAGAINLLFEMAAKMLEWFKEIDWEAYGHLAADFIKLGLDTILEFVTTGLPAFLKRVETWFDSIDWKLFGDNVITLVLEGLSAISDFITITLPTFWDDIKAWFEEKDWAQIGIDMILGLIEGIGSMAQALLEAVINIAVGAWDAWTRYWDEHSPSRRMEGGGINIMAGFVKGVTGMSDEVNAAFKATGAMAYNTVMPAGMSAIAAGQGGDNQFTIGPNTISNGMDDALFEARVRQVVAKAIR